MRELLALLAAHYHDCASDTARVRTLQKDLKFLRDAQDIVCGPKTGEGTTLRYRRAPQDYYDLQLEQLVTVADSVRLDAKKMPDAIGIGQNFVALAIRADVESLLSKTRCTAGRGTIFAPYYKDIYEAADEENEAYSLQNPL